MPFCVTNSQKRGMAPPAQITYSRRTTWSSPLVATLNTNSSARQLLDQPISKADLILGDTDAKSSQPLKHSLRTEEAASSSTERSSPVPTHRALRSSAEPQSDSDLSSPPATPSTRLSSPDIKVRKPIASFLRNNLDNRKKRRRSEVEDDDETGATSTASSDKLERILKRPRQAMTQMKIDLGGDIKKTCRTCEMEYIPSVLEDAETHKKFCKSNQIGIGMGKAFLRDDTVRKLWSEITAGSENEVIAVVDRGCSLTARNKAKAVLQVVNTELGAADLEDDALWAEHTYDNAGNSLNGTDSATCKPSSKRGKGASCPQRTQDHFKTFFHLIGDRCVAFCMAEKIIRAYPVVPDASRIDDDGFLVPVVKSSSVSYSTKSDLALLGIYRIWTSRAYRSKGLAINLLDVARSNFFYGVQAPKDLVAFSQPTASGKELAERYFKMDFGWKVYSGGS